MRRSPVKTGYLFKIGALTKPLQTYQGKIVSQYWCHKISSILYASNEMLWPHCHIFDEFIYFFTIISFICSVMTVKSIS